MGYFEIRENLAVGYPIRRYPPLGELGFKDGELLDLPADTVLRFGVDCPADAFPGHFFNGTIPVMSAKLIEALRAAGIDNFQIFPAILIGTGGAEWTGYFAFNAVGLVDSLDLAKSDDGIEVMPGGDDGPPALCSFDHPVVDPQKARGLLMFREVKMPPLLVFDDRLERFLAELRPPEGWGIRLRYLNEKYDPRE